MVLYSKAEKVVQASLNCLAIKRANVVVDAAQSRRRIPIQQTSSCETGTWLRVFFQSVVVKRCLRRLSSTLRLQGHVAFVPNPRKTK